jgi:hypothetical protein
MRRTTSLLDLPFAMLHLGLEAQAVVGLRLMQAATGGGSARENARMISEKITALAEAQRAAALGLATDGPAGAIDQALRIYRRHVRANHRRLRGR